MEVINVIVFEKGIINGVQSFVIGNDENIDAIVDKAESLFSKLVEKNNPQLTEDEIYSYIEDGYYGDKSGYELILTWSSEL